MIVELSNIDLLKLANDEQITVGDLIVRTTNGDSKILAPVSGDPIMVEEVSAIRAEARANVTGNRTRRRSRNPNGVPAFKTALFNSRCDEDGCKNFISKGSLYLRDSVEGKNYCVAHGTKRFPDVEQPVVSA